MPVTHLLVLGLRGPRALGEEAVLIAGGAGDGRPAAGAGVLIEQRYRAEFRYRIIVRRVNCTVRVHRCGWYSKGGASAEGDGVLIAVRANALLPGRMWVHRRWHRSRGDSTCACVYVLGCAYPACVRNREYVPYRYWCRRVRAPHTWVIDVGALVVQHHVFHLHNDGAVAVVRRVL